ncbi:MAG: RNase adapter RapZ [Dongiaceae bacterium]
MSKAKKSRSGAARARPVRATRTGAGRRRIVIVTGLSGAGHSTALKALEDLGYEAVDNLPLFLLAGLTADADRERRPIAIGVDSRTRDFSAGALGGWLDRLKSAADRDVRLLFLDCGDEALRRRFSETRRRHPLALDRPVGDGIRHERRLLGPVRELADLVIDTTDLAIGDLKRVLRGQFALDRRSEAAITIISFAYRNGLPREADLVFDARFLRNPHYEPALKPLTGRDRAVGRFVDADPALAPFFDGLTGLLAPLLPRFEQEGKSYLTIAIGCTGGKHRSVLVAERLAQWLGRRGRIAIVRHRDAGLADAEA